MADVLLRFTILCLAAAAGLGPLIVLAVLATQTSGLTSIDFLKGLAFSAWAAVPFAMLSIPVARRRLLPKQLMAYLGVCVFLAVSGTVGYGLLVLCRYQWEHSPRNWTDAVAEMSFSTIPLIQLLIALTALATVRPSRDEREGVHR